MTEGPYLDTSALAKWYINEPGSAEFSSFVVGLPFAFISRLSLVEFRCLLARRRRAGELAATTVRSVWQAFQDQIAQGFISVAALDDHHAVVALELLDRLDRHPLRALDALHLAIALDLDVEVVATADRVLAAAARDAGLEAMVFAGSQA